VTEITEVHPPAPLFFLSYAHSGIRDPHAPPRAANRDVIKFFYDLSENVAWLVSRPTGSDPGYLDQSIGYGSLWTEELLQVLGTCQVFVALLSGPYTTSGWCGKEWHAFARRKVTSHHGTDRQNAIIPVTWAPFPADRTPPAILAVQRFSPSGLPDADIVAEYEKEGMLGLMRTDHISYCAVVWRLARYIADFHHGHDVEPRAISASELHDIFQERAS
jgi:hypothetical protein